MRRGAASAERWEQRFQWPMVVAALLVIPVLVVQESELGEPWQAIADVLNWGTWLAFLAEFVVMMAVTPKPWTWIKQHPIDFAALVLSPPFLPNSLTGIRVLRLFRVLRIARAFSARNLLSLEGIQFAAFLTAFVVIVGGISFSIVEPDQAPNAWDGVWWAVTTVTTVGYGDVYPATALGRVIGAVVMAVGIGFVALLTAFVAERFIRVDTGAEIKSEESAILAEIEKLGQRLDRIERRLDGD